MRPKEYCLYVLIIQQRGSCCQEVEGNLAEYWCKTLLLEERIQDRLLRVQVIEA
jgi:hypothetical protein